MNRTRLGLMAALLVAFGFSLRAGGQVPTPRAEMLRLVPPDVALCLTIDDLGGLSPKLNHAACLRAIKDSPLGQLLGDTPQWLQLDGLKKHVSSRLHISWEELREDFLGDAVVFAYRPGPAAHPEQDAGLLLIHAREPVRLPRLIERHKQERTKAGKLKAVVPADYKGFNYFHCVASRGKDAVQGEGEGEGDLFYFLDGPLLAVSWQEAMLKQMFDCRANPLHAAPETLAHPAEPADKPLATAWINPRAFDESLAAQAKELGDTAEGKSLDIFLKYWKALEGISLSLQVNKTPELVVAVNASIDLLPASARKVVQDAAFPSDCWKRFAAENIFAVAGRSDIKALMDVLNDLSPNDSEDGITALLQRSLGLPIHQELLQSLASSLGPDWGYCVMPAPDKTAFPHVLFAARVRMAATLPQSGKTVVSSVHKVVAAAVGEYNGKHQDQIEMRVSTTQYGEVHYLVNDRRYPKGFQPAFTYRDGYFLAASSSPALEHFKVLPPELIAKGGPSPGIKFSPIKPAASKANEAVPVSVTPLARVSFRGLTALVKDRQAAVLDFMSTQRQLSGQAAEARYRELTTALSLFDKANLAQHVQGNRVKWVIRLQAANE